MKNFDWEYYTDLFTQRFFCFKYNCLDYLETKEICEEEVIKLLYDEDDSLSKVRERIRARVKKESERKNW